MIETTRIGEAAVLGLAHGKANALDLDFLNAIVDRFNALRNAPERAIVLTGQGRMFSAGVDLPRLIEGGATYVREFLPALHKLYDTVFHFPKPVIAAVNGHAIAGGCVLACCADKRIAARDAGRIGVTELLVGVPFPAMAFEVMRFATAPQFLPDVILRGPTFLPDEALRRGLIDEVVVADQLMDRALAEAKALASLDPATFAMTKAQLRQPVVDRMTKDGPRVDAQAERIWTSPETLALVRDYVAKTLKKG